ncbi:membrane protein of unknown function DUF898 [Citrifermentans bemidjiense Bem]|uniref:DUF898 domain-containing protein n=1 Tax=Citrifermentans bemidjiense (strain ATCC BAA-1014 / DSM 16622 / JCM 12645 / Bem) TaxID=404380 RepID=B5ECB4_CITBB|nr:DUF898 family protein [Citrifermentans bemidjiense]ACH37542.1 membrane protein of unknown function DUF898 [Citrifermentans bemidjiense Bem]
MPSITLTCPVCNFTKQMDVSAIPRPGTTVTCPVCKSLFPLQTDAQGVASEAGNTPALPEENQTPPSSKPVRQRPRTLTFAFTGDAREYFGIWIVNTLLRIVTLGFYSPWAKVRKRRYFCGNTLLDGAPFDYLADPWAILKGWLVAGLFFGLYSLTSRISPLIFAAISLLFLGIFPWVVVRSRIFNLRNSTHRNIHFGFNPEYREAYRVFLGWQLLLPLTIGILGPYVFYRQSRFLVENSRYGTTPFSFHATATDYFKIFLPLLVLIPVGFGAAVGIGVGAGVGFHNEKGAAVGIVFLLFALVYLIAGIYVRTALTNLAWNSTSLGQHRFASALRVRDLLWIYLSSAVAVICTLGLLAPWAVVRMVRYRLERTTVSGVGGFDAIRASEDQQVGAGPEELVDMVGFDLGL